MADTMVKDIVYLGPKTWRNAAGTDLETSFLLANFHGARRCMPIPVGGGGSGLPSALLSYEACKPQ